MEPRRITPKENSPLNRLFFAINHYVSTGDRVGEGVAVPWEGSEGAVMVMIPVNTRMEQDRRDFRAFRARMHQLEEPWGRPLHDLGRQGVFHMYGLLVREEEMDALAEKLREEPGPEGWGSMKATIDRHFSDR